MPNFAPILPVDERDLTGPHVLPEPAETFCEDLVRGEGQPNESINATKSSICDLRTLRNSRASVNHLPPELLLHIFSLLIGTTAPPSSANVIPITWVCRAWRTLALGAPNLWGSIYGGNPSQKHAVITEMFIARSKNAPLDIDLPFTLSPPAFLDHIHGRIRSLKVYCHDRTTAILIAKQLARERTPYLRTLRIRAPPSAQVPSLSFYGEDSAVDGPSPMPSLRSLCLFPTSFPWSSNIYCNLSVLDIEGPGLSPPTEERMLQILQRCPGLTTFKLGVNGDLVKPRISPTNSAWDASLPLLSTFALKTISVACAGSLLSHLILPHITSFALTLRSDTSRVSSPLYPRLFPRSPDRIPVLSTLNVLQLEETWGRGGHLSKFSFWESNSPALSRDEVTLYLADTDFRIPSLLGDLLDTVETFITEQPKCGWWLAWHDIFCCTPRLRELCFSASDIADLVRALDDLIRPPTAPSVYPLDFPCPKLETLDFRFAQFDLALEDRVVNTVRERAARGYPLRYIILCECEKRHGFVRGSRTTPRGALCRGDVSQRGRASTSKSRGAIIVRVEVSWRVLSGPSDRRARWKSTWGEQRMLDETPTTDIPIIESCIESVGRWSIVSDSAGDLLPFHNTTTSLYGVRAEV
ncbi:hypothetical protein C2E23DRAFT_281418 [Lenzites betulinus]|nr:hypothetical protein C2E23DRAFT_281418 [Lenzites betulinus]